MVSQTARKERPKLDRDLVVEAAINRVERHGLEELSARKLAQDLGCEAMSLYHHVGNMDELKDAMVDRLLRSIAPANVSEPVEALRRESESYLDLAREYSRCFQLVATRRWKGETGLAAAARAVSHFNALGFDPREGMARARMLGSFINGAGLALAAWANDPEARPGDAEEVRADLGRGLERLIQSLTQASWSNRS